MAAFNGCQATVRPRRFTLLRRKPALMFEIKLTPGMNPNTTARQLLELFSAAGAACPQLKHDVLSVDCNAAAATAWHEKQNAKLNHPRVADWVWWGSIGENVRWGVSFWDSRGNFIGWRKCFGKQIHAQSKTAAVRQFRLFWFLYIGVRGPAIHNSLCPCDECVAERTENESDYDD